MKSCGFISRSRTSVSPGRLVNSVCKRFAREELESTWVLSFKVTVICLGSVMRALSSAIISVVATLGAAFSSTRKLPRSSTALSSSNWEESSSYELEKISRSTLPFRSSRVAIAQGRPSRFLLRFIVVHTPPKATREPCSSASRSVLFRGA